MRNAGSSAGDVTREWEAFASLLLRWARDPVSLSGPHLRQQRGAGGGGRGDYGGGRGDRGSTSQSTDATTDAATPGVTPGGSVDSGPSAAWEALLQSEQHR